MLICCLVLGGCRGSGTGPTGSVPIGLVPAAPGTLTVPARAPEGGALTGEHEVMLSILGGSLTVSLRRPDVGLGTADTAPACVRMHRVGVVVWEASPEGGRLVAQDGQELDPRVCHRPGAPSSNLGVAPFRLEAMGDEQLTGRYVTLFYELSYGRWEQAVEEPWVGPSTGPPTVQRVHLDMPSWALAELAERRRLALGSESPQS